MSFFPQVAERLEELREADAEVELAHASTVVESANHPAGPHTQQLADAAITASQTAHGSLADTTPRTELDPPSDTPTELETESDAEVVDHPVLKRQKSTFF